MFIPPFHFAVFYVVFVQGALAIVAGDSCNHDNCLRAFLGAGSIGVSFCQTYSPGVTIPAFAANCDGAATRITSACSCIYTAIPPAGSSSSSSTSSSTATSETVTTTSPVASPSTLTSSSISVTSITSIISTSGPTVTTEATPCLCTAWSQIAPAVAACMDITLSDITAPKSSAIILTKLQTGASVTFAGTTNFTYTNSSQFRPIQINGNNITITGAPGSIIDGSGQLYWDGLGTNGGRPKPGPFMKLQMTNNSIMKDLYIQNYPAHGIDVDGVRDSTIKNVIMNNSLADAPNTISNGLSAGHNTDGFDVANSVNLVIDGCKVWGQDDCVVVSESINVTVRNAFCSGTHGLSMNEGGTGCCYNSSNILFTDSVVTNSTNGLRIKTDYQGSGSALNVTYSNIALSNIKQYGIDIEQDYLNGGPNDLPTNGVSLTNIIFKNITGWVVPEAQDYYVLCGVGSCHGITYENVNITGGMVDSSCNYPWSGCPGP